jgi:MFS family permease
MSDAGFGGYAALLAVPPRTRVVLSGLIARAPIAVLGFGMLFFAHDRTGSYAVGGAASGLAVAAMGVIGPFAGRIADRHGQRQILLASAVLHPIAIAGAIVFGVLGSVPLLILFSVLCGITVAPVGAFMRARWSALVQDQGLLRTAFAIEAVADEVVWVFGPAVAALLASSVVTSGGLVLSGILGPAGAIFLRLMPEPANTDHAESAHEPFRLLRSAPFIVLLLMSFATGLCFGINDLTVISMATSDGVPALAGTVLTAYSIGSASGGIVFGAISPRFRSTPMLVGTCAGLLLTWGCLSLVPSMWWLYPVGLFAGATIAPFMIAVNHVAHSIVPAGIVTEALAWLNTLVIAGMSVGSFAGGVINDGSGPRAAFAVVAVIAAAPLVLVLAFRPVFIRLPAAYGGEPVAE